MSSKDIQIEELQRELAVTRLDFSTRLNQLEQKVINLQNGEEPPSQFDESHIETNKLSTKQNSTSLSKADTQLAVFSKDSQSPPTSASKPAYINNFLQETGQYVAGLLSPLTKFVSPLINLYQHYQTKGQGPIFVFMLIGIVLLVAGFGYLTQLLVGELGAGSKSLLLFVVAMGTTLSGAYLTKLKKYSEFSSAIVGLGLLLNYMTIYMAGSFYQLLPGWAVLLSYFAIAGIGFVFANKFETKIVSALSVIGGAAIPLISQLDQSGTSYYLIGLGFIVATSLYQAISKNWQWLSIVSIFVTYSCLEYLLMFSSTSQLIPIFSQIFYCLFLYYLYRLLTAQIYISKNIILLSVMTLFSHIGIFYQSEAMSVWILPTLASINAMLSSYLVLLAKKHHRYAISVHIMFASTWLLVAIVCSLAPDYWGFAIGIEGLFILYLALKENYFSIRLEAYVLLTFAILHAVFAVLPYFPDPALLTLKGNLVTASIGGLIFCTRKLLSSSANKHDWEVRLNHQLRSIESVWFCGFVLALLWVQLGVWMAIAVLPLQVWLFTKTYRQSCKMSELMVYLASAVAVGICIFGINQVQSFSFRDLPNYAKAALIFVFIESWLFAEFYRRTNRVGPLANVAELLRLGFYLVLPLTFIPSAIKHYTEYSAIAFWASAAIVYALGRIIKHPLIRTETLIIFAVSALYNLGFYIDVYHQHTTLRLVASIMGLATFSYFAVNVCTRHATLLDKKIASLGLYFLAGCIAIYMQELTNFIWAGALTSLYIFGLTLYAGQNKLLIRNRRMLGYLSFISILISWLTITITITSRSDAISSSVWVVLSAAISLTYLIKTPLLTQLDLRLFNQSKTGYTLQHILLSICGAFILNKWDLTLLITPWLILHGSYLFFTHKESKFIAKLALVFIGLGLLKLGLVDAANALLWQKVALMIGIGLCMLSAAFVYQKRMTLTESETQN